MPRAGQKHLSDEHWSKLLVAFESVEEFQPEYVLTELLMVTGMRQGELCTLTRESFDLEKGFILIQPTKNSHPRRLKFRESLRVRLEMLFEVMAELQMTYLYQIFSDSEERASQTRQVRRMVTDVMEAILGPGVHYNVHCLRHTWALKQYNACGKEMLVLQKLMGHKSINSTVRYIQYCEAEDYADSAMDAVYA